MCLDARHEKRKLYISFLTTAVKLVDATLAKWHLTLVHHHSIHAPEHIGQFAGSLLPFNESQHK
jgi:hypothetical protein